jgi:hypothetical protein
MQVFAANDASVLGNRSAVPLPVTGETVFFGWEHAAGIGKVRFNTSLWILLDNIEFYPIPEPLSVALAGASLAGFAVAHARRRRR